MIINQKISQYTSNKENLVYFIYASYAGNGGKEWAMKTDINICQGNKF